jgi:hypothetical protein
MAISFDHHRQLEMYRSFELLDMFGENYYEDDFISLLSDPNIDGMDRQTRFEEMVYTKALAVVVLHGIKMSSSCVLKDINEVLSGLYIIQHLEDYSYLLYRLSSITNNEKVLADILSTYTTYDAVKYIDVIESVSDTFLAQLRGLVAARVSDPGYNPDEAHLRMVKNLFSFTKGTATIGGSLMNDGVGINNTLSQLVALLPYELAPVLSEQATKDPIQTALDIVMFILMAKDTFQSPMVAYKRYASLFLVTSDLVTLLEPVFTKIIIDSNRHLEVTEMQKTQQKETRNEEA